MPLIPREYTPLFRAHVDAIMVAADLGDGVGWDCFRLAQGKHKPARHVLWVPVSSVRLEIGQQGRWCAETRRFVAFSHAELVRVESRITGKGDDDGEGIEDAEFIRQNVMAAFRLLTDRRSSTGGVRYETQRPGGAANVHNGQELVIQDFNLWLAIPKEVTPTVKVTSLSQTCKLLPANPFPKTGASVGPFGTFPGPTIAKA